MGSMLKKLEILTGASQMNLVCTRELQKKYKRYGFIRQTRYVEELTGHEINRSSQVCNQIIPPVQSFYRSHISSHEFVLNHRLE